MNKLEIAKAVTCGVIGYGVSHIISDTIESNVRTEKTHHQVGTFAAKAAITYIVAGAIEERVSNDIDKAVAWWNEHVKKPLTQKT